MKSSWILLSAALVALGPWPGEVLARPSKPGTASDDPGQKAMAAFVEGQKLYDAGSYSEALDKFREVDELLKSPNARLYMGRCLRELGRLPEAFEVMTEAVAAANEKAKSDPSYLRTRDAAAAEREAIVPRIGRITVAADSPPEGLQIQVGTRTLRSAEIGREIGVDAGDLVVDATAPGYQPFHRELTIDAGRQQSIAVVLRREGEAGDGGGGDGAGTQSTAVRDAGFGILALGVVGMGVFAVTGSMSNSKYATLEEECATPPCTDPKYVDVIDEGKTLDVVANVGLGVGLAGIVVGALMVGLGWPSSEASAADTSEPDSPDAEPAEEGTEQSLSFDVGPAGGWIGYQLRF